MNHPKTIQITIPHPCSQNWDEMTPAQQGRFCAHCQKTVIDFSTWSDTALYNFFSKDQGHVCGRFLSTQVDRKIAIPYQPHSRLYRIAIAMGLTLMFTQTPELFAQNRPPKVQQHSIAKSNICDTSERLKVSIPASQETIIPCNSHSFITGGAKSSELPPPALRSKHYDTIAIPHLKTVKHEIQQPKNN